MAFTKFKLLAERLLSGLGRSKTFFPFYDSQNDADYRVSLDTLITFISNELGVSSKAVFELTGISNTGNNYVSTLSINSYKTESLWIFKPSNDSDDVSTLNVDSKGALQIKEFNGTSLVDKTDLKSVNTYLLLNKTTYWLVVGGVSGNGDPTFGTLPDSPYDNTLLAEALNSKQDKPNGVLTGCTITLGSFPLGKNVRITEGTWRISPGEYGNVGSGDTDFLVTLSASGLQRYVEIVGTSSNTIIKVEGAENAIAVRPTLGAGQTSLGSILVKDALIDPPVPDLSGYIPLTGSNSITGDLRSTNSLFRIGNSLDKRIEFGPYGVLIRDERTSTDGIFQIYNDGTNVTAGISVSNPSNSATSRGINVILSDKYEFFQDIIKYTGLTHIEIAAKINADPYSLTTRQYSDDRYIRVIVVSNNFTAENNKIYQTIGSLTITDPTPIGGLGYDVLIMSTNVVVGGVTYSIAGTYIRRRYVGGVWVSYLISGVTNLGYTPSATNGVVTSDTGTDATLTLVDGTNAGLVSPSMKSTWDNKQNTLFVPSDAEMQTGTDNVKYATALRVTTWWTWIKTQAQTIAGLWTFSGGITISGGRLLFTNTFTAGGDSWYRQASNVLRAAINGTDRIELNTSGVRTKGTHTFEGTMFTNIVPTVKKIATVQTTGELTADYVATTIYQGIQRTLQTLVSSTTETAIFNPEIGSTLIPSTQFFLGSQWLYTIPFKLSTTGTVRFIVRFGEAATGLTSRTILADTGTFSPSVTAQGGVLKVFFTVATLGASGTANLVCNIEVQINGKNPVISVPLRTTSGVSTLVDNLLEITCVFGTSSTSDRIDVENANAIKIS